MPALLKELLHDYVTHNLDIETRVSIAYSIECLYKSGVASKQDILLLDHYYRGYNAEEIAILFMLSTSTVSGILARLLLAIEHSSGYTDEQFIQKISNTYNERQIKHATQQLEKYSKEFDYENMASRSI